jgi:hypothetical protein
MTAMKNLFLITLLFTQVATADDMCHMKILDAGGDSQHFQMNVALVNSNPNERMDAQMALNAANYVNIQKDCKVILTETNSKVACDDSLIKYKNICKVEAPYGYFIIFKDYVDTVHTVFNRWD